MSFAQAVQHGAMVEPTQGEPDMPPLLADFKLRVRTVRA
jgi:hypothetical protein